MRTQPGTKKQQLISAWKNWLKPSKLLSRQCRGMVRDGAAGVNVDEKELFSDLRKDLLTGDNDTVIRCEAEMLPAKSSLCCKIWTIHLSLENPPLVRWNLTSWAVNTNKDTDIYTTTHTLLVSLQLPLEPLFKTYEPWNSNLSKLPPVQGCWDKWLIRVTVLS